MGTTNSCLPISIKRSHLLCGRSSISQSKYNSYQRTVHKNPININCASADELLFLPKITRPLAENIIEYRDEHDGFKEADEMLEVHGITSNLFQRIQTDITINSSSTNSLANKKEPINLNLASYNHLCSIPGLKRKLVKRIIQHRKKHGLFYSVQDLLNIKGVDPVLLANIHPYVTADYQENQISVENSLLTNLHILLSQCNNNNNTKVTVSLISRLLETLPTSLHTVLLSSLSSRPLTSNNNNNNMSSSKKNILRFASWNLQQLTAEKMENPGVREVICRTIIENDLSLIGIQDIRHIESLDLITQELNNPTIPLLQQWPNARRGRWKSIISDIAAETDEGPEYLGFIYDESIGISVKKAALLPFKTYFSCLPYITTLRIYDKYDFVFVNIHLKTKSTMPSENEQRKNETKSLSVLAQAMKNTIEQKHIVIFGNFNDKLTVSDFEPLHKCNYSSVIQQNTDISLKDPTGTTCLDNIWLSYEAKSLSTGNSGVIRDNLSNFWIPTGWSWGGLVSNYCPIWTEFDLP